MSTKNLAKYVRDLMGLSLADIEIGRDNFNRTDFSSTLVVVDEIASVPIGKTSKFDGDNEQIVTIIKWKGDFTLDFFGDNAASLVSSFMLLNEGEDAYTLQRDMGISVYTGSTRSDLKNLTGSQYSPDYQLEIKLEYNESITVPTLRIDTAETELITNT